MHQWHNTHKNGDIMTGVSRFLSKRERKSKSSSVENAGTCETVCPELYKVFTPEDTKKKADKDEDKKVKAVTQRLTQLGIANLRDAQIEYALRAKNSNGDVDKAINLLQVFEDSVEGIVREYQPTMKLLGAENRQAVTCYLDALLFAMFAKLDSFEALLFDTFTDTPRKNLASLLRLWVNMLRSGKLITADIVMHIQNALADCGWADAAKLQQQDTSEAFTFITDKLQLPLLTLKMDIYHFGKEDIKDDHKVVHERLLEVAIPEKEEGTVTLEECLENYFNNRIEVKRHLHRRNTLQSLRSCQTPKSEAVHIETAEISPSPSRPTSPVIPAAESPVTQTPASPPNFLSSRLRTDSIFSEKRVLIDEERGRSKDDVSIKSNRPRASTIRKEVLMPAWQFFSLIPWYTDDTANPTSDAQVAAHFSTKRPVLGICLKRYQILENGKSKRLNTHVDIPLEIALPEFVSDEHKYEDFGDFKLSLESVVCHRGTSTNAGHYIALVRGVAPRSPTTDRPASADGKPVDTPWMRFDDLAAERVTFVDIEKALKDESPYLLFYQVQPIDDDPPPSYAEAHEDSPPQHPIANGHLVIDSETDLTTSSVLGAGNGATGTSIENLAARLPATLTDNSSQPPESTEHLPLPTVQSEPDLPSKYPAGSSANSTKVEPSIATTASQSNTELSFTPEKGRDSLDVSRRRGSVTLDVATLPLSNTLTPSTSTTAKTPSTAPDTPAEEGGKSWLPSITGSRRNSRSEKGRSSEIGRSKDKRPSSQSGDNRLSLTMSQLSSKLSKDKLLNRLIPSNAANATSTNTGPIATDDESVMINVTQPSPGPSLVTHADADPAVTLTVPFSSTVATTAVPNASASTSTTATPPPAKPRHSFDLLTAPKSAATAPTDPNTTKDKNGGTIGRSRSLRHKHMLGLGSSTSDDKDKKRSKSRGHDVRDLLANGDVAAAARSSTETDGVAGASGSGHGAVDGSGAAGVGSMKRRKGMGISASGAGNGERPERECAVM